MYAIRSYYGLGGLIAVIGGTLFVVLAFVAVFRGRARQAAEAD